MKKIMLITAIVMAVSSVQAASFAWKTSGIKAVEGTGTITCSAILTAYATGTDTVIGTWNGDIVNGVLNGASSGLTIASDSLVGGTKYDFIFVATTTVGDKEYVWTSTTKSSTAQATSTPSLSWFAANHTTGEGINANGWAAVPEPTSGLLMLLGLAGLALKRKRA